MGCEAGTGGMRDGFPFHPPTHLEREAALLQENDPGPLPGRRLHGPANAQKRSLVYISLIRILVYVEAHFSTMPLVGARAFLSAVGKVNERTKVLSLGPAHCCKPSTTCRVKERALSV